MVIQENNLVKTIYTSYGGRESAWRKADRSMTSKVGVWTGIFKAIEIFFSGFTFNLGKRDKISFLKDPWCGNVPLRYQFPSL